MSSIVNNVSIAGKAAVLVLLVVIGLSACEGSLTDLNENPNDPEEVPANLVLPNAILNTMNEQYSMEGLSGYVGSVWVQHYAKIQYVDEDRYELSGRIGMVDDFWDDFYSVTLADLQSIKQQAMSDSLDPVGSANIVGIANILMAWNYQLMTDLWGPVPASEALQAGDLSGEDEDPITSPSFDSQEVVYDYIIQLLNEATSSIDVSGAAPFGSEDLIFSGNLDQWLRLANSLKLRAYMRLAEVAPEKAETGIAEVFADGNYMQSNADNAGLDYQDYPYNNPVNEFFRTREDHKISLTMTETLKSLEDPRLHFYAMPYESANVYNNSALQQQYPDGRYPDSLYVGVVNGDVNNSLPLSDASNIGAYFMAPRSPGFIMTYSEVEFILSEAALRGWIETTAEAETHYNNAIEASMLMYTQDRMDEALGGFTDDLVYAQQDVRQQEFPSGIRQEEITTYLAGPAAWPAGGSFETQLQAVAQQKWIALYGQGLQAWFEWRRLDYPTLEPGPEAVLNEVPKRLFYPFAEQSVNNANYQKALEMLNGPDNLTTHVWWDVDETLN